MQPYDTAPLAEAPEPGAFTESSYRSRPVGCLAWNAWNIVLPFLRIHRPQRWSQGVSSLVLATRPGSFGFSAKSPETVRAAAVYSGTLGTASFGSGQAWQVWGFDRGSTAKINFRRCVGEVVHPSGRRLT